MITVNIGGCNNKHPKNFMVRHENGSSDYLLLLTKSDTYFLIDGKEYNTPPGAFVLLDKNISSEYGNKKGIYINDWIHFDFHMEEANFRALDIPLNRPIMLYDIPSLSLIINLIADELYSNSKYHIKILDHYMHVLLYRISDQMKQEGELAVSKQMRLKMKEIRSQIYNESQNDWIIESICKDLNVSLSYFQHTYKQIFGVSCTKDIINARIEQAKFYLVHSVMAINEIARLCGYKNEEHFSRQFKQLIGLSPRQYRDKMNARKG